MRRIVLVLGSEDLEIALLGALAADYNVSVCHSYDTLFSQPCDVLILDLFLPGVDGISLLRDCREYSPPTIIALTELLTSDILQVANDLNINIMIRKPFSISSIAVILAKVQK